MKKFFVYIIMIASVLLSACTAPESTTQTTTGEQTSANDIRKTFEKAYDGAMDKLVNDVAPAGNPEF